MVKELYGLHDTDVYKILTDDLDQSKYYIIWVDGENFSKYTKKFEKPFDSMFRDMMTSLASSLMSSGSLKVKFAYTESDEISLVVGDLNDTFKGRVEKIISRYSGLASALFSDLHQTVFNTEMERFNPLILFDCKIVQCNDKEAAMKFIGMRIEDSRRNFINTTAYWKLRKGGYSGAVASKMLKGVNNDSVRNTYNITIEDIEDYWMKWGTVLHWEDYTKDGFNPITNEIVIVKRRRVISKYFSTYFQYVDIMMRELSYEN